MASPGASPNVLAERLKKLEELEIVARRKLPPPAASVVYELTPLGLGLAPVARELLRWGLNLLTERRAGERIRLEHVLFVLRSVADPGAAVGLRESYEFHVEDHTFCLAAEGPVEVEPGPAPDPAATITTDFATLAAIGAGRLSAPQALADGRLELEGDPQAALRASRIFPARAQANPLAAVPSDTTGTRDGDPASSSDPTETTRAAEPATTG